jgi:DNA-binding winged helix-turn-helix (wHTH) protein/TolB-like protein
MKVLRGHHYIFGEFQFEVESHALFYQGKPLPLPLKAATLLRLFLERYGEVISKQEIYEALWSNETVEESNLTRNIYLLRKAFNQVGVDSEAEQFIETLPKIGYRFRARVQEVLPAAFDPVSERPPQPLPISPTTQAESTPIPKAENSAPPVPAPIRVQSSLEEPALGLGSGQARAEVVSDSFAPPSTLAITLATGPFARRGLLLSGMVVFVVLGVLYWFGRWPFTPSFKINSLAVLPFPELGDERREVEFGLGLADTLISRLGNLGGLEVRPTAAIRRYVEKAVDPLQAGRELRVDAILTGHLQRAGEKTRLTAQLLRVVDGRTLWSATFDEPHTDWFVLQDRLTNQFIAALRLPLPEAAQQQIQKHGTENLAAYQLYLKGRLFWGRRTRDWILQGIECFEAALRLDPNYAQAYAGLADSYALTASGFTALERMPKAKAAALKALELDDSLAEAHASLGFIKYKFEWDWRGAGASFQRAIALNPNYATAHHWYAECLSLQGRFTEAQAAYQQAERLDPLSLAIKEDIGMSHYQARNYSEALAKYREVQELDPQYARVWLKLTDLYLQLGQPDEAVKAHLTWWARFKADPVHGQAFRQAYEQGGLKAAWQKEIELTLTGQLALSAHRLALVSMRAGDAEAALKWLEKSFEERGEGPLRLKTDPEFGPLRQDPRFQALLQRAGHTP